MHETSGARRKYKKKEVCRRLRRCSITTAVKAATCEKQTALQCELLEEMCCLF